MGNFRQQSQSQVLFHYKTRPQTALKTPPLAKAFLGDNASSACRERKNQDRLCLANPSLRLACFFRRAQLDQDRGIVDTQHNSERFREMYHLNEVAAFRKQAQTFEDVVAYSGWDTVLLHQALERYVCVITPAVIFGEFLQFSVAASDNKTPNPAPAPSPCSATPFGGHISAVNPSSAPRSSTNSHAPSSVMPPRLTSLYGADFYIPISWNRPEPANYEQAMDQNDPMYFFATGLLKPNVSRATWRIL